MMVVGNLYRWLLVPTFQVNVWQYQNSHESSIQMTLLHSAVQSDITL